MQEPQQKDSQDTEKGWSVNVDSMPVSDVDNNAQSSQDELLSWTASEFVAHQKDSAWYGYAVAAGIGVAAVVFLFTRDVFSTAMVIIAAGIFIAAAARPPRVLSYSLSNKGVTIANKFYPYEKFKAFSVINEGAFHSITLDPLERFMPSLTVYYDPADEKKIADVLNIHLPYQERQQAPVDRLMRKIRF